MTLQICSLPANNKTAVADAQLADGGPAAPAHCENVVTKTTRFTTASLGWAKGFGIKSASDQITLSLEYPA